MTALAVGTQVRFTGLPANHPLMNSLHADGPNGPMGVVQGVGYYSPLGPNPQYAIRVGVPGKTQMAVFYPIDGAFVVAATSPNPTFPFPSVQAGWQPPNHHSANP
jgi:hypothetical protein